jgi:predicted RNA binding protein YcfA (HicA-like mRNA interferase family)
MSKLPHVSGREAVKAFERAGFSHVRTRGSHYILSKEGHPNLIVVPVHGSEAVATGTLRSLIRDAGLTVEQFNEML